MVPNSVGKLPVKKRQRWDDASPSTSIGIFPVKELLLSASDFMDERSPNSVGSMPVKKLLETASFVTNKSCPVSVGIVPTREFPS